MSRFPFPMPFGWFSVGRVDEFTEPVTTVDAFGGQVVVWRDGDGEMHVIDPFCPHLGAHLGVGGTVPESGCLRCPFHHWEFDGDGANTVIPYADSINRKARVFTYPTRVVNGHVAAWYHPDRSVEPTFEIDQVLTDGHVRAMSFDRIIGTAWQEVAENSVDMAHFKYVHGTGEVRPIGNYSTDGPFRLVESVQSFGSSKGNIDGELVSRSSGPGFGHIEFRLFATVTLIPSVTPLADDRVHVRFTIYHDGSEVGEKIAAPFAAEIERQFDDDIPIWENKRYIPVPALAPSEKPVTDFRKWASQFYA